MEPNEGIFQDGLEAAFLHGASPIDNDYGTMAVSPHLNFQRWSWLLGYAEGLRMRIERQRLLSPDE